MKKENKSRKECSGKSNNLSLYEALGTLYSKFKGTVSVISRDNARCIRVPLKALSDQVLIRHQCFYYLVSQ